MSGPIVRKYGFPNHEKIFGKKPIEHGVDESDSPTPDSPVSSEATTRPTDRVLPADDPNAPRSGGSAW